MSGVKVISYNTTLSVIDIALDMVRQHIDFGKSERLFFIKGMAMQVVSSLIDKEFQCEVSMIDGYVKVSI